MSEPPRTASPGASYRRATYMAAGYLLAEILTDPTLTDPEERSAYAEALRWLEVARPEYVNLVVDRSVEQPYEFRGGPWNGHLTTVPRALSPTHCMPRGEASVGGGTWAAADSWPGRERYVPAGQDGDTVVMTWRLPTNAELDAARIWREEHDEEKRYEIYLDARDEARADADHER